MCGSLAECTVGLVGRSDGGREPISVDSTGSHAPGRTVNPSLLNWKQSGVPQSSRVGLASHVRRIPTSLQKISTGFFEVCVSWY